MTQDNHTEGTLPDETHVDSAGGGAAAVSLPLAELNTYLGKDFKDTDTALKALKDTQSFVGKRKEDIASEIRVELEAKQATAAAGAANASSGGSSNTALESTVKSLQEDLFYTNNPQYKDMRDTIKAMGANPADVVQTDAFKKVFEKVQVANDVESKKSVVSSNARLAQTKTHTENAVAVANAAGSSKEDVAAALVGGIREALDLSA